MATLQGYTINGAIIESARWPVDSLQNIHIDDVIHVSLQSSDKELLTWISSKSNRELGVEKPKDSKEYSVILPLRIARFKHLLESNSNTIESMAQVIPTNRDAELILIYILDFKNSDPRFKEIVKKKK